MIPNDRHAAAPDVTDSVMRRLGYHRAADAAELRSMRRRRIAIASLQGTVVLAACALGAAWWMGQTRSDRTQPAVGDALRGSIVQGAGKLDSILLGMPRVPNTSVMQAPEAPRSQELPSKSPEPAPHVRSY
jgi:hypothetical protein